MGGERDPSNVRLPERLHQKELRVVLLNLGCGARTHPQWVNIDYSPTARLASVPVVRNFLKPLPDGYRNWDLRKGIPFDSASVDAIYSSHVLEHLEREAARGFLRETARVLRPGGIVR